MRKYHQYSSMSDRELIDRILQTPKDEALQAYFYNILCLPILNFVSTQHFGNNRGEELLGEFYEFLSSNDWQVLRNYAGRENATLRSYITSCTLKYFMKCKKKARKEMLGITININHPDIIEEMNNITVEPADSTKPIMQAVERLPERDKQLITMLFFKKKSTLETAAVVWPLSYHVEKDWRKLPAKKVQDAISRMKSKALVVLCNEYNKLNTEQNSI